MADHGLPAQQTRPAAGYPFQASPSRHPADMGYGGRYANAANPQSTAYSARGLVSSAYAWYTKPCMLPKHPREALLTTAITIFVMLLFWAFCKWIATLWRVRRNGSAARINKKQQ